MSAALLLDFGRMSLAGQSTSGDCGAAFHVPRPGFSYGSGQQLPSSCGFSSAHLTTASSCPSYVHGPTPHQQAAGPSSPSGSAAERRARLALRIQIPTEATTEEAAVCEGLNMRSSPERHPNIWPEFQQHQLQETFHQYLMAQQQQQEMLQYQQQMQQYQLHQQQMQQQQYGVPMQ